MHPSLRNVLDRLFAVENATHANAVEGGAVASHVEWIGRLVHGQFSAYAQGVIAIVQSTSKVRSAWCGGIVQIVQCALWGGWTSECNQTWREGGQGAIERQRPMRVLEWLRAKEG